MTDKDKLRYKLDPEGFLREVSIMIHELLCLSNHTDGCGWYYEIENAKHDWDKPYHKEWRSQTKIHYIQMMSEKGISLEKLKTAINAVDYVNKLRGKLWGV